MADPARPSSPEPRRTPYEGTRRKLVLAFDVGTTFSGISYSLLDPGQIPSIKGVTQFPAQEATSTACKIPTIIYYDQQGKVRAAGAEATQDGVFEQAQEENWSKAEWFKLHLRSKFGNSKHLVESLPSLPPGKSVVDVISDFLSYLLECTSIYIQDTLPNGKELWQDFRSGTLSPDTIPATDGIQFVLSHPNGWEGQEQKQMRKASVKAGLIPDTSEGHKRITFVSEGEASLHFAVQSGLLSHIAANESIVVVDAGGGTIDVSTYRRQDGQLEAKTFEEIAVPRCYFHGSVFVTLAAKNFLQNALAASPFLDDLDHLTSCFDRTTKLRFRTDQDAQYIKFGGTRDNDARAKIRFGQMKLSGTDIAKFFRESINCVVQAVMEQKRRSPSTICHVVLVGGFSASSWLFHKVRDILTEREMTVIRPENNVVKAVSDGAISFYLDHHVRSRVAKVAYGVKCDIFYQAKDPDHLKRKNASFKNPDGKMMIRGGFDVILAKGTRVKEEQEFCQSFYRQSLRPNALSTIAVAVIGYRGEIENPTWVDADPGKRNFSSIFELLADLSRVPRQAQVNPEGGTYYQVEYDIVVLFGLTEIQAYVRWKEDGVSKRSSASIIYE